MADILLLEPGYSNKYLIFTNIFMEIMFGLQKEDYRKHLKIKSGIECM